MRHLFWNLGVVQRYTFFGANFSNQFAILSDDFERHFIGDIAQLIGIWQSWIDGKTVNNGGDAWCNKAK